MNEDTLRVDNLMRRIIVVSGIAVIASVLGLFLFILAQAFPLFRNAEIRPGPPLPIQGGETRALVGGEFQYAAVRIGLDGRFHFIEKDHGEGSRAGKDLVLEAFSEESATSMHFDPTEKQWWFGMADGRVRSGRIAYSTRRSDGTLLPEPRPELVPDRTFRLGTETGSLVDLDVVSNERQVLYAALERMKNGRYRILGRLEVLSRAIFEPSRIVEAYDWSLDGSQSDPLHVVCGPDGRSLYVLDAEGWISTYVWEYERFNLVESFSVFADLNGAGEIAMAPLHGRRTLAFWSPEAATARFFTPVYDPETRKTRLIETSRTSMEGTGPMTLVPSQGNRSVLLLRGNQLGLHYVTTNQRRWEGRLPFEPVKAAMTRQYDALLFLDGEGRFFRYSLEDPYPEAGFSGLFTKIHYEGRPAPEYAWQSSGGSDEFEPKLSLVPLLFGSLKGSLFALLFSIPIALCSAIYTSQFMARELRVWVKPIIELMASIPSVILGLLAAIWFGPQILNHLPSLVSLMILIPSVGMVGGLVWSRVPARFRRWIPAGREIWLILPLFLISGWVAWVIGAWAEHQFFRIYNPDTGNSVGDFALWWTTEAGLRMEQRNSVIIGLFLGFAVIPLIYSVAEEALSSVPRNLISGSLALGASRWQTTRRIVIPTAAAGILSAVMIGMGRAVGETMIVLMAAGNTPLLDMNLLSGFRALAANIAIELPEATEGGVLYRTMFLGAALLFFMSFIFNTAADFLRSHLRRKFRILE